MPTTTDPDQVEGNPMDPLEEDAFPLQEGPRPGLTGTIPRLPNSRPPRRPTTTDPETGPTTPLPPPVTPSGPVSGRSSTVSTDPTRPVVDPKDFREAVRDAVDIGFVLGGQFVGSVHASRTGQTRDAQRWLPTVAERRRVANPAHRIARRHIVNSSDTMDAVDVALMAAGIGAYASRAAFGLAELEEVPDDDE
jgi:hypothetical protein